MRNKMVERRQFQTRSSRYRCLYLVTAGIVFIIIAIALICFAVTDGEKEKEKENNNLTEVSTETRQAKIALLPTNCGQNPGEEKIANGNNATIGQFPWMALIGGYRSRSQPFLSYFCGGTIINKNYILTAAHCTVNPSMKLELVVLGELNLLTKIDCNLYSGTEVCADEPLVMKVSKVIPHWKYNSSSKSYRHDIALLRLEQEIPEYTDFIQPVCLPLNMKLDEDYLRNKSLTIAGWGNTFGSTFHADLLQYAEIQTFELDKCNEAVLPLEPMSVLPINELQICAIGENLTEACSTDSGGPLLDIVAEPPDIKFTQLGIVSFKFDMHCGTFKRPSVFTRVDKYLDWILDTIEE